MSTPQPLTTANLAACNVRIKGMTTEEIARTIRDRLLAVEGVVRVRMSITDSSARVEYLPSIVSPTSIATYIGQMGYSFTVRSMRRTM
jgi:cation transport ATPase